MIFELSTSSPVLCIPAFLINSISILKSEKWLLVTPVS